MIKYRNCPECNSKIEYTTEYGYTKAIELNTKCNSCAHKNLPSIQFEYKYSCKCVDCGDEISFAYEKYFKKIDINTFKCKKCRKLSEKECLVCGKKFKSIKGKTCSDSCKFKHISREKYGVDNPSMDPTIKKRVSEKGRYFSKNPTTGSKNYMFGKKHTESTKNIIRTKWAERRNDYGCVQNFNPLACEAIEEYGKLHGYNFQHALNGGEYLIRGLGYFVDGYDKEKNVVIEYDEPYHYINGKLRDYDVVRQKQIEEFLKCIFIRITGPSSKGKIKYKK